MLLSVRTGDRLPGARGLPPRFMLLRCDRCQVEFEYPYSKPKAERQFHFCSFKCSQAARSKDGVLRPVMEATMRRKMGDDWQDQIAQKIQASLTPEQRKARGQKAKQTVLERYGANSATQIPHVREKCMEARIQSDVVARQQMTVQERYGVKSVLSLPHVHALANTPEKCQQRHETMKRNGSYFNSSTERAFGDWLVERFGEADVERQKVVNGWPIDFYVKSLDTYIQFDGEYWHGLNRSLQEIAQFKTPRDRTILLKHQIDRRQDAWFRENGMKLVRITDKQFARGDITV